MLVLAPPAHLGSWLPVHGNPGQLGQTGAPHTLVHLITDVGQPQGHLVSAGRCQEVRHGYAGRSYHPPSGVFLGGLKVQREVGSGLLGASSKGVPLIHEYTLE